MPEGCPWPREIPLGIMLALNDGNDWNGNLQEISGPDMVSDICHYLQDMKTVGELSPVLVLQKVQNYCVKIAECQETWGLVLPLAIVSAINSKDFAFYSSIALAEGHHEV